MKPQDWRDVLTEFQAAYSRYGQDEFTIIAVEPGKSFPGGWGSLKGGGGVHIKREAATTKHVMFVLTVLGGSPEAVWASWEELAGKAGAMLTPEQITEAGIFGEDEAQAVWAAFLVQRLSGGGFVGRFVREEDACSRHLTVGNIGGLGHLTAIVNPFGASVRAVQFLVNETETCAGASKSALKTDELSASRQHAGAAQMLESPADLSFSGPKNEGSLQRHLLFISYSHKDRKFLTELRAHLKPLTRDKTISEWSDEQIEVGSKWFDDIRQALASTKVAVMLVTKDFLASDFIREHELQPLLKAAGSGDVRICWVPVCACTHKETPLNKYQAIIPSDKPLAQMSKAERDAAWVKICEGINKAMHS